MVHDHILTAISVGVSVTARGSPIAGENYTLECSAGGSEGVFHWLEPPDGRTPIVKSIGPLLSITSTATSSQLQFRPVQQSDNGSYSCNASVDGLTFSSDPIDVNVNGISSKHTQPHNRYV